MARGLNVGTGRPILSYKNGRAYICVTRTLFLPCDCIVGIRQSYSGETQVITNKGLQRVLEPMDDVMAAYEEGLRGDGHDERA